MDISKENNFISVVIYVHDIEHIITDALKTLYRVISDNFINFEFICVDDASSDCSASQICQVSSKFESGSVSLIHMGYFHGVEKSMNAGVDLAIGDFVFEIDSPLIDYNPEMLIELYNKSLQGYDIVGACPAKKKLYSKMFYKVLSYASGNTYILNTETVRILSRRAINRVGSISRNAFYRKILYASSGLKTAEIQYDNARHAVINYDNITHAIRKSLAIDTLIVFTNIAYRISFSLSVIMAAFMFSAGIYTVISYIGFRRPIEGWAPLMGLISAGFMGVFLILTIIIKYLDILVRYTFSRQSYLISSIDKLL